jgi:hypothetical protein
MDRPHLEKMYPAPLLLGDLPAAEHMPEKLINAPSTRLQSERAASHK